MTSDGSPDRAPQPSLRRRSLIGLVGAGLLGSIAGCSGGDGVPTATTEIPSVATTVTTDQPTAVTAPSSSPPEPSTSTPPTTRQTTTIEPTETTVPATVFDIVVAADGSGDFVHVQPAIDAIDGDPDTETTILIEPGTYYEKIEIPEGTDNVTFVGRDPASTILTYDDRADVTGTTGSASFYAYGSQFTARNITFRNSAEPVAQAVAALVNGDRSLFRNCRFIGNQDTLYAQGHGSRQYYKDCYIEGDVDFIFGGATAVFDGCEIFCKEDGGYITAASTPRSEADGYVFKECAITRTEAPDDSYYLGRPWRPYAQTVFLRCSMDDHIKPEGWNNWGDPDKEETAYYAEHANTGPGYTPIDRVGWAHILSDEEANPYWLVFSDWDPMNKVQV